MWPRAKPKNGPRGSTGRITRSRAADAVAADTVAAEAFAEDALGADAVAAEAFAEDALGADALVADPPPPAPDPAGDAASTAAPPPDPWKRSFWLLVPQPCAATITATITPSTRPSRTIRTRMSKVRY
jgi:hypothetical protein